MVFCASGYERLWGVSLRRACPHVHTDNVPFTHMCMQMASFCACSRGGSRSAVEMYGWSKTIARCPCTPPSTMETFGEKISAEACSGKEIAGLLRKMMMMMNMMTRNREIACERILMCQTGGR